MTEKQLYLRKERKKKKTFSKTWRSMREYDLNFYPCGYVTGRNWLWLFFPPPHCKLYFCKKWNTLIVSFERHHCYTFSPYPSSDMAALTFAITFWGISGYFLNPGRMVTSMIQVHTSTGISNQKLALLTHFDLTGTDPGILPVIGFQAAEIWGTTALPYYHG